MFGIKPKRPVRRRRTKTVEEREREEELRLRQEARRTLKVSDPERYKQIMLEKALADLGISPRRERRESQGFLDSLLNSELANGIGQALASRMLQGTPLAVPGRTTVRTAPPATTPPPTADPAPAVSAAAPDPSLPAATAPVMTPESEWLIRAVQGKSPEETAHWLCQLDFPLVKQVVAIVGQTGDERLPELWGEVARVHPALAPFLAWLPQQPGYLDTIHAIRAHQLQQVTNGQAHQAAVTSP